jgi:hypothetical protein
MPGGLPAMGEQYMSEAPPAAGDATSPTVTTTTPPEPSPVTTTEPKPTDDLGDAGKRAIADERKARKEAERKAAELAARVDEFEKAKLTEKERAEKELADAQAAAKAAREEAAAAQLDALRHRIAAKNGVPAELLTGLTEDDLTSSAEAALKWRGAATPEPPKAPKPDPSVGPRGEQVTSGAELYRQSHPKRTPA